ncbi:MAG: peptidase S10 [Burkholderiaceae bacterium]|nr:peptidase S10 [Burkholderiaceae bacterium]
MPDPISDTEAKPDLAKRQREQVQALLARAPATGSGRVTTAAGATLDYQVRAAFVPVYTAGLDAERGEPQAAVLTTAYTVATPPDRPQRGVCFAFNGGPGSASLWLHLGALGPKRVPVDDNGRLLPAPYGLVDNPHTWLGQFDLVFIDPPHTGWSASASDAARKKHLSVDGDVAVMAEVVRGWLAANGRFGAPLYLCGESYGTTRGAAIADALLDLGLGLDGVILVSCAMDLQSLVFAPRNDLPHALFLPAYATTAQYHGALDGALGASGEAARQAAEAFVAEDYLSALHAGARLDGTRRRRIAKRLCELTGLPRAVVEEHNLRIRDSAFFVEALRARGQLVGRLDSRATAPMAATREREMAFDPGIEGIAVPYTTAAMAYFATLGLPVEQRYEALNFDAHRQWDWRRGKGEGMVEANGFTSTGDDLARALRRNPNTRVLVASGRYDLGTPYSATDWSLAQLDAPAEVLARISHRYYDAGHMMYTRSADLAQMQADLAAWLQAPAAAG